MNPDPNTNANVDLNGVKWLGIPLIHGTSPKIILIAVAIAAVVFALDLLAPLGISGGVPYVALVLFGWWFPERSAVLYLAAAGSVLTLLGYFFSPDSGIGWVVLTNRALAIMAIWATAAFLWWVWRERAQHPQGSHRPMEKTWEDQTPFLSMGSEGFFVAILVTVIVASSWGALTRIEDRSKDDIEKSLKIALETSYASIRRKFDGQKKAARVWANDFQVRGAVLELTALPRDATSLINSFPQEELRTRMTPLLEHVGYRGFFVIAKDNINLASSRDGNIGAASLLTRQEGFLARIWAGETVISLPQPSDDPLRDTTGEMIEHLPTMFVATPIKGAGEKIIAIFAFRLDPDTFFTPIFHLGRFGHSGETYAIDRKGVLISESRFNDNLRQIGLITAKHSDLNLEIRDPGIDMTLGGKPALPRGEQPLTRMAQSVTAGQSGMDLEGYRDYRGVPVVGIWLWDDELGFGITSEITIEEAFASFYNTRYVILAFSALAIGVLVVLALVSSRTRKRIAQSEKKYRTSINSTSEGYWLVDVLGRILEVNQAFCQMLGRPPDELLGKNPAEFASDETRGTIEQQAAKIPTTNHRSYEAVFENKHGKPIHAHINGTTIWGPQGKATGAFAFITDITEIKQVEEGLRQAKAEADKAKAEADKANRAKSEFLANMSHDLRTPLNAIMGFAHMMKSKAYGPLGDTHYEEYADDIHNSGSLLVSLIDDILDLSKVEAGKYILEEETLKVPSLIQNSVKMISTQLETRKLHLATSIETNFPTLRGDEKAITQVLNNLLSNAVKFTPADGNITVSAMLDGDGAINLLVADTGEGMSSDDITKALNPFEQVNSLRSKRHEGTGLGLHLCQKFMKLHDGDIKLKSKPGKGTTVIVHFPPDRTVYPSKTSSRISESRCRYRREG